MRCDTVTRELTTPSGRFAPSVLVAHLAVCPACAAFASASERLDHAWAATTPPSPPVDAFDGVWARVTAVASDQSFIPGSARNRPARPRWGTPWLRAAVVFVALGLGLGLGVARYGSTPADLAGPQPSPTPLRPTIEPTRVEIAEGQVVMIPLDGHTDVQVVELVPEAASPSALAPDFDVLNEFEAMASL